MKHTAQFVEVPSGFEPENEGFADLYFARYCGRKQRLTTRYCGLKRRDKAVIYIMLKA